MLLTICADDFGLHPEIDEGIINLVRAKRVHATSVLINSPNLSHDRLQEVVHLGAAIGSHLTFTEMKPVIVHQLEKPWLTPKGSFLNHWKDLAPYLFYKKIPQSYIEQEWSAQITLLKKIAGRVDFIDSHQNVHLIPPFTSIVRAVAQKEGALPVRVFCDRLRLQQPLYSLATLCGQFGLQGISTLPTVGIFSSGNLNLNSLSDTFKQLGHKINHLVLAVHPGITKCLSTEVVHLPSYTLSWRQEYDLLLSDEFETWCRENDVTLAHFDGTPAKDRFITNLANP
jgi:predicted glycoside hydrolase/deacetylase ChbG (UPF0249 family)